MVSLVNPAIAYHLLKGYVIEKDRIWRDDIEKINNFKDKQFRKIIRYAYDVPIYRKKYREAGIRPDDIKGIGDIKKLPFI
ncbi:MAG: hypothetical protein U9O96_06250, partial [Candidatus Thermoplasmatota archaeon]|nr:hypothetical protein [Candidatus Thermoplasmatota archaeon]